MTHRLSLRLFSVRGIPVYAHLSLPIGLAIVCGFSFRPLAWLGLMVVVLVHELGHAFLLRHYRLPVLSITLHAAGGECATTDWITRWQESVVAWGGVLAQGLLLILASTAASLGFLPHNVASNDFYTTITAFNLLMLVFNLLPMGNLDGTRAWRIVGFALLKLRHSHLKLRLSRLERESLAEKRTLH